MEFKEGDRVKIIEGEASVEEDNGGLGMEGVILLVNEYDCVCEVISDEFVNYEAYMFRFEQLELIEEPLVPVSRASNDSCPRCGGKMLLKESESYGMIQKCSNCGYC